MMKERTLKLLDNFFERYPKLDYLKDNLHRAIKLLSDCALNGNKILVCGNGGSCADSEHLAGEFNKSFLLKRKIDVDLEKKIKQMYPDDYDMFINNLQKGIPTIPLTSMSGFVTAYLNDCEPSMVYAQGVNTFAKPNDILIAISTSGNSKNVVNACKLANALDVKIISLTGQTGGKLKDLSTILLNAPSTIVYEIQEYHLPIYHILCLATESEVFEN